MSVLQEYKAFIIFGVFTFLLFLEIFFPYFESLFLDNKDRFKHDLKNLTIGLFNAALVALVFSGVYGKLTAWTHENNFGLLQFVSWPWLRFILALLLFDFWMYFWHRISHRVSFLWRFHRVHHSDRQMDASSAFRFHFGEILISFLLRVPIVALLGLSFFELLIYEMVLNPVILFHHSNINLSQTWDKLLNLLIVTPNMHRVHHSDCPRETHSNFSSIFSFWDKLFGSFVRVVNYRRIQFGLKQYEAPDNQEIKNLFKAPFRP